MRHCAKLDRLRHPASAKGGTIRQGRDQLQYQKTEAGNGSTDSHAKVHGILAKWNPSRHYHRIRHTRTTKMNSRRLAPIHFRDVC